MHHHHIYGGENIINLQSFGKAVYNTYQLKIAFFFFGHDSPQIFPRATKEIACRCLITPSINLLCGQAIVNHFLQS